MVHIFATFTINACMLTFCAAWAQKVLSAKEPGLVIKNLFQIATASSHQKNMQKIKQELKLYSLESNRIKLVIK